MREPIDDPTPNELLNRRVNVTSMQCQRREAQKRLDGTPRRTVSLARRSGKSAMAHRGTSLSGDHQLPLCFTRMSMNGVTPPWCF